jgi:ion channel-forming bestrophin family protein
LADKFSIDTALQNRPNLFFAVVFDFFSTETLRKMIFSTLLVGLYVLILNILERYYLHVAFKPPSTIFYLIGLVLGLLLVFRTNTAYDRWWQGRIQISYLSNAAKCLSSKMNAYIDATDIETRQFFAHEITNHAFSMKEVLRFGVRFDELIESTPGELSDLKKVYHVPSEVTARLMLKLTQMYREKKLTFPQYLELHKYIDIMTDVVGNCERIRTSPMPFSYRIHLKKFIVFFALISPFYFIHEIDNWAVLVIMVIYYSLMGLETIGEEIEDPFGQDENDLPIDYVCNSIKTYAYNLLKVPVSHAENHNEKTHVH